MNIQETGKYVALCAAMWPSWKPNAATVDAWHLVLQNTPYGLARDALLIDADGDFPPPPGKIVNRCKTKGPDAAEIINVIDAWYAANDDVNRRPNREDEDKHPTAALAWKMLGGYNALHDQAWAHQRIRSVLPQVREIVAQRLNDDRLGITSGQAREFMRELSTHQPEPLQLGQ